MGEVLHEVDFSQLKIENQQYIEKIDERNQELLRLKMMAGSTLQVALTVSCCVSITQVRCSSSSCFQPYRCRYQLRPLFSVLCFL